jgi:hypothetical protein
MRRWWVWVADVWALQRSAGKQNIIYTGQALDTSPPNKRELHQSDLCENSQALLIRPGRARSKETNRPKETIGPQSRIDVIYLRRNLGRREAITACGMWINDQAYGPLASHIGPSILLLITIKEARFCSKKNQRSSSLCNFQINGSFRLVVQILICTQIITTQEN